MVDRSRVSAIKMNRKSKNKEKKLVLRKFPSKLQQAYRLVKFGGSCLAAPMSRTIVLKEDRCLQSNGKQYLYSDFDYLRLEVRPRETMSGFRQDRWPQDCNYRVKVSVLGRPLQIYFPQRQIAEDWIFQVNCRTHQGKARELVCDASAVFKIKIATAIISIIRNNSKKKAQWFNSISEAGQVREECPQAPRRTLLRRETRIRNQEEQIGSQRKSTFHLQPVVVVHNPPNPPKTRKSIEFLKQPIDHLSIKRYSRDGQGLKAILKQSSYSVRKDNSQIQEDSRLSSSEMSFQPKLVLELSRQPLEDQPKQASCLKSNSLDLLMQIQDPPQLQPQFKMRNDQRVEVQLSDDSQLISQIISKLEHKFIRQNDSALTVRVQQIFFCELDKPRLKITMHQTNRVQTLVDLTIGDHLSFILPSALASAPGFYLTIQLQKYRTVVQHFKIARPQHCPFKYYVSLADSQNNKAVIELAVTTGEQDCKNLAEYSIYGQKQPAQIPAKFVPLFASAFGLSSEQYEFSRLFRAQIEASRYFKRTMQYNLADIVREIEFANRRSSRELSPQTKQLLFTMAQQGFVQTDRLTLWQALLQTTRLSDQAGSQIKQRHGRHPDSVLNVTDYLRQNLQSIDSVLLASAYSDINYFCLNKQPSDQSRSQLLEVVQLYLSYISAVQVSLVYSTTLIPIAWAVLSLVAWQGRSEARRSVVGQAFWLFVGIVRAVGGSMYRSDLSRGYFIGQGLEGLRKSSAQAKLVLKELNYQLNYKINRLGLDCVRLLAHPILTLLAEDLPLATLYHLWDAFILQTRLPEKVGFLQTACALSLARLSGIQHGIDSAEDLQTLIKLQLWWANPLSFVRQVLSQVGKDFSYELTKQDQAVMRLFQEKQNLNEGLNGFMRRVDYSSDNLRLIANLLFPSPRLQNQLFDLGSDRLRPVATCCHLLVQCDKLSRNLELQVRGQGKTARLMLGGRSRYFRLSCKVRGIRFTKEGCFLSQWLELDRYRQDCIVRELVLLNRNGDLEGSLTISVIVETNMRGQPRAARSKDLSTYFQQLSDYPGTQSLRTHDHDVLDQFLKLRELYPRIIFPAIEQVQHQCVESLVVGSKRFAAAVEEVLCQGQGNQSLSSGQQDSDQKVDFATFFVAALLHCRLPKDRKATLLYDFFAEQVTMNELNVSQILEIVHHVFLVYSESRAVSSSSLSCQDSSAQQVLLSYLAVSERQGLQGLLLHPAKLRDFKLPQPQVSILRGGHQVPVQVLQQKGVSDCSAQEALLRLSQTVLPLLDYQTVIGQQDFALRFRACVEASYFQGFECSYLCTSDPSTLPVHIVTVSVLERSEEKVLLLLSPDSTSAGQEFKIEPWQSLLQLSSRIGIKQRVRFKLKTGGEVMAWQCILSALGQLWLVLQ